MCQKIGIIATLLDDEILFRKITCRSWSCPDCAKFRRRKLVAQARSGNPNKFITLTVNPHWFEGPNDRAARLARAWRDIVREFRRRNPHQEAEYMAVFEATKHGEPHLHIMWRGGFIAQRWLSSQMQKRMGAKIVDVRQVDNQERVAAYCAKYISKRPIRFGNCKRFWRSKNYLPKKDARAVAAGVSKALYFMSKKHLMQWAEMLIDRGLTLHFDTPHSFRAKLPPGLRAPPGFFLPEALNYAPSDDDFAAAGGDVPF